MNSRLLHMKVYLTLSILTLAIMVGAVQTKNTYFSIIEAEQFDAKVIQNHSMNKTLTIKKEQNPISIDKWKKEFVLNLKFNGDIIKVSNNVFLFSKSSNTKQISPFSAHINEALLKSEIEKFNRERLYRKVDVDKFKSDLITFANKFEVGAVELNLANYLLKHQKDSAKKQNDTHSNQHNRNIEEQKYWGSPDEIMKGQ